MKIFATVDSDDGLGRRRTLLIGVSGREGESDVDAGTLVAPNW